MFFLNNKKSRGHNPGSLLKEVTAQAPPSFLLYYVSMWLLSLLIQRI